MKNALLGIAASLAVHAALAALAMACCRGASAPDVAVSLDLAHVELSFAEREDDSAKSAAAPAPADQPPRRAAPEPPKPDQPKPPERTTSQNAPDAPADPSAPAVPETPPPLDSPPPQAQPAAAAEEAPRQARVDAQPQLRRSIRPEYPAGARERGEHGDVTLEIAVDAAGTATEVVVAKSCGFPELDDAAVKAARRASFIPAKAGGKAVASRARIQLKFRLK